MRIDFPSKGRYVVAVSGGVDSVVLLDILQAKPGLELVVAHFDHGIRPESKKDRQFVHSLAKDYGLRFVYMEGRLGAKASEAEAREARYNFLRKSLKSEDATAIITAHHQDDVLETAIINMLRGTGRKGLTALRDQPHIKRPLLKASKKELHDYAKNRRLEWREDPTNEDTAYLRNYVRHKLLPKFNETDRGKLVAILAKLDTTNEELDAKLAGKLSIYSNEGRLERDWFNQLPHAVAKEVMASWLRANDVREFDSRGLERLVVAAKTAKSGKCIDVIKGVSMKVNKDNLALVSPER